LTWISGPGARGAILRIAAIGLEGPQEVRNARAAAAVKAKIGRFGNESEFFVDALDCPDEALPVLAARIAELEKEGATGIVATKPTPGAALTTREGEGLAPLFRITKDDKVAFIGGWPMENFPRVLILPNVDTLPETRWLIGFHFVSAEQAAIGPAPALVLVIGRDSAAVEDDANAMRARWPAAHVEVLLSPTPRSARR
jgi:hypothetical protein